MVGILWIPVTMSPEVPPRFEWTGGWTTRLTGVKGVEGKLDLWELTGGGSTPLTERVEVNTKWLSSTEDMIIPIGTPKTGESKGLTWTITGSFKSVKGVLKFLANSSVCSSSILTVSRSKRLAMSYGSPRTSLIPTGSNEPSVSNLLLWGRGGGSNVVRGGRFLNLLDLLGGWSSRIENLANHTLRPTKHRKNHRAYTIKILKPQTIKQGWKMYFPEES